MLCTQDSEEVRLEVEGSAMRGPTTSSVLVSLGETLGMYVSDRFEKRWVKSAPVRVGQVVDGQLREVLPGDASVVLGARRDVRSKQSPMPGLGNTYARLDFVLTVDGM